MNLLLTSDFKYVGVNYLNRFFSDFKGKTCLWVGYAKEEDSAMYESSTKELIASIGFNVVDLTPKYNFQDKLDMIYVHGGNTTKLIDYLKKYNQFNRIRELVQKQDVLYVGLSAGSVLAGSDTEWTLRKEPYPVDMKAKYGKDALMGFGWVDKLVFVHTSRYRYLWDDEYIDGSRNWRTYNIEYYKDYLEDTKIYKKGTYIKVGNNQVYLRKGNTSKMLTQNWSKVPIYKK